VTRGRSYTYKTHLSGFKSPRRRTLFVQLGFVIARTRCNISTGDRPQRGDEN